MPCIPPDSVDSGKRFPPKTSSGPPVGGVRCRQCGSFHPARESPRFRDFPVQDRLCRRMDRLIVPPSVFTIPCGGRRSKREKPRARWKNVLAPGIGPDEQLRCTGYPFISDQNGLPGCRGENRGNESGDTRPAARHERRQKNTRGETSGERMHCPDGRTVRTADSDRNHFGMRKPGIGICISSYMFMYCAKRM